MLIITRTNEYFNTDRSMVAKCVHSHGSNAHSHTFGDSQRDGISLKVPDLSCKQSEYVDVICTRIVKMCFAIICCLLCVVSCLIKVYCYC